MKGESGVMDPREKPRYSVPEVASYVRMKPRTLESWVRSRGDAPPIIQRPVAGDPRLSYNNLIEAYVLNALRKNMRVSMQKIRSGIEWIEGEFEVRRCLLSEQLRTRYGHILFEDQERFYNAGLGGQVEIPEVVREYLRRIDYENGYPVRLYPVTRTDDPTGPQRIVILPDIGFGKPVTKDHFISAAVIADRFRAGEAIEDLAEDYDLSIADIEEAIRTESVPLAA